MSAPHWEIQLPAFSLLHLPQLLSCTSWAGLCGTGSSTTAPAWSPCPLLLPCNVSHRAGMLVSYKHYSDGFILLLIVLRIKSNLLWGCHLSSAQPLPLPLATIYLSPGYICLLSVPKHVRLVSILGLLHLQKVFKKPFKVGIEKNNQNLFPSIFQVTRTVPGTLLLPDNMC